MSGRWFRFYEGALDDPKVQTLPADDFKSWVNILCVACRNDGAIPPVAALAFMLRMPENACQTLIERLVNAGLIDRRNGGPNGSHHAPHGWDKRQYKSDTSSARVKRYRERSTAVTETPPYTEADTDTESKKKRGAEAQSDLAFAGKIIRLKMLDFKRWKKAFPHIQDMMAELTKADDYYSEKPPADGKWYFPVSSWLDKANKDAAPKRYDWNTDPANRGVL